GVPLNIVMLPGFATGVSLMELAGIEALVTVRQSPGGPVVYQRAISLDALPVATWYDYFFSVPEARTDLTLTDLPPLYGVELTISITGAPACGLAVVGEVSDLGDTEAGVQLGIIDYSQKNTDSYGRTSIVKRRFAKRMTARCVFSRDALPRVYRLLATSRATPCVWVGSEASGHEPLAVYGFYRDFNVDVAYPTLNYCNLEIEGLI
uniref:hypothetical protein n=1 Tax=Caldimonas tepidiphila TaxID=2315841 RepID=UPI001300359C